MRQTARRVFLDPSTPSVRSIIRVVIITLLLIAVFDFTKSILASLTKLFFIVVLAVFFAYLIDPLVKVIRNPFKDRHLERLMPRTLAIVIAYIIVFTIFGAAIANLSPVISQQARDFANSLPGYTTSIQQKINQLNARFSRLQLSENVQNNISTKTSNMSAKWRQVSVAFDHVSAVACSRSGSGFLFPQGCQSLPRNALAVRAFGEMAGARRIHSFRCQ